MKPNSRPVHPRLPSDEDRNIAIIHVVRGNMSKLGLNSAFATFRRVANRVLITYTPNAGTNQQSSDWVNVSTSQATSY